MIDTCVRRCSVQLCVVIVHLREAELAKAEEQLKKMSSSTEAKIDKLVLIPDVPHTFTCSCIQMKSRYSRNYYPTLHSRKTFCVVAATVCYCCVHRVT